MKVMLKLKVEIDNSSGFCFGVVYAIDMAEEILNEQGYLYCLGDIVHNDEEIKRLESLGLQIINYDQLRKLRNEKVLIRAHGEPPSTYETALKNNLTLIDASCPVVLKLQNRIRKAYDRSEKIFIYGKHGHAEVLGLLGQTNNEAVVFQNYEELAGHEIPEKVALFSQTTKSVDKFYEIADALKKSGAEVEANDTICRQVSNRDAELRTFASNFDKIVFVAGTKSSNGKVLYEVCKSQNPNSYFVSESVQLKREWFSPQERVGICGATSTPMWLMEEVRDVLLTY